MGKQWKQWQTSFFLGSKITADGDFSHEIKRHLLLGRKANSILKKTEILLCQQRSISSQSYGFSGSHVWMWELHHKDSLVVKNWCFWTAVLERTLESPLNCKEIQSVHSKGDQSWVFFGKTDAKAETPILWPPYAKSWLIIINSWCLLSTCTMPTTILSP